MSFQTGHTTNIGRKQSEESNRKRSEAMRGRKMPLWLKEKLRLSHLGKKQKQETREKIRQAHLTSGLKPPSFAGKKHTEEAKNKIRNARKLRFILLGFLNTPEAREKIRQSVIKTLPTRKPRSPYLLPKAPARTADARYKQYRKWVFDRDFSTCQCCGTTEGRLELDHELSWRDYPDLRFEILNGRVLCHPCHKKTPNYGSRVKRQEIYA